MDLSEKEKLERTRRNEASALLLKLTHAYAEPEE